MNQTEYPSLAANDAVAGFVFQQHEAIDSISVDRKKLEKSYVDLISKLENLLTKAKALSKVDFVDESATFGRKMLESLQKFCDEFLTGQAAAQAREEIDRAMTISYTYDEVLKTRSLTNAILRTFWKVDEIQEIQSSHAQLGQAPDTRLRGHAVPCHHACWI